MNNIIRLKRIKKEIVNFCDNDLQILHDEDDINIIVIIQSKFKFVLNKKYPFSAPQLFINDINYLQFFKIKNKNLNNILNENSILCPCCNSILCFWCPTYIMSDVIDEYYKNIKLLKYLYKYYLLQKISKKLL